MDWSLNPYVGCSHACAYCYASFMKRFTGHGEPWGEFVDAKENITKVLARQLRRKKSGRVMLASVTDAWQPIEKSRGLTRACLELLASSDLSVSALTKSDLVVRDADILKAFGGLLRERRLTLGFSLTTASDELASIIEPGASPPSARLDALEHLASEGVETWVFMAPVLPALTDSPRDLLSLAKEARRRGAQEVRLDPLNFYPAAVKQVSKVIARHRPEAGETWRSVLKRPDEWRKRVSAVARSLEET